MMKRELHKDIEGLGIGTMSTPDMREVLGVLARGMRDNPLHIAAFGEDPQVRERRISRLFSRAMPVLGLHRHALLARNGNGAVLGVVGMQVPGQCQPGVGQQLRLMPAMLSLGPRSAGRAMKWMGTWSKHDPGEPHWHLGPVAVDAHLQGVGIGSKLMSAFAAKMDAAGEDAYLETDKDINVRFYEKFGFEVVGEEDVLGVPNWFMFRHPER